MRRYKHFIFLLLCAFSLLVSGCKNNEISLTNLFEQKGIIYISAAASLSDVMQEIGKEYEIKHPNIKIVYNFANSGALQSQIEQGAPID